MENEKITNEPEVVFNAISDLRTFGVKSEETRESVFEITGYDLQVQFNRSAMKSLEDVEGVLEAIKDLFRKLIMEDLLNTSESEESVGNMQ